VRTTAYAAAGEPRLPTGLVEWVAFLGCFGLVEGAYMQAKNAVLGEQGRTD
jgi:hypothetical protein